MDDGATRHAVAPAPESFSQGPELGGRRVPLQDNVAIDGQEFAS
jgi:hypothetical protein